MIFKKINIKKIFDICGFKRCRLSKADLFALCGLVLFTFSVFQITAECKENATSKDTVNYKSTFLYQDNKDGFYIIGRMLTPRYDHGAILLSDGNIFIVGGYTTNRQELKTTEIFNPNTGKTIQGPDLHFTRVQPVLFSLNNGDILIVGDGYDEDNIPVEIYSQKTNSIKLVGYSYRFLPKKIKYVNDNEVAVIYPTSISYHNFIYNTETELMRKYDLPKDFEKDIEDVPNYVKSAFTLSDGNILKFKYKYPNYGYKITEYNSKTQQTTSKIYESPAYGAPLLMLNNDRIVLLGGITRGPLIDRYNNITNKIYIWKRK